MARIKAGRFEPMWDLWRKLPRETKAGVRAMAGMWRQPLAATVAVLLLRGLRDAESMAVCRVCGCTDWEPCIDEQSGEPCHWAGEDLCSQCAVSKQGG
jgi:hypothetical protein